MKPQNVMVGAGGHVYLSDFGLAKQALATAGPTTSEHWVGTLDYVAPEQIRGEPVDGRADVYALGGVLSFMLTARVPFDRPTDDAKLWAHLHDPPPARRRRGPGCRAAFDAIVARAMAKDPAARQPTAGDLGFAARRGGRGPRAAGDGVRTATRRPPAGGAARGAGVAAAAAGLAAVGGRGRLAPRRRRGPGPPRGRAARAATGRDAGRPPRPAPPRDRPDVPGRGLPSPRRPRGRRRGVGR